MTLRRGIELVDAVMQHRLGQLPLVATDPQALFSSKRWYLQPADTARPPGTKPPPELPSPLRIVTARNVLINVWRDAPTVEQMRAFGSAGRALHRTRGGAGGTAPGCRSSVPTCWA